MQQFDSATLLPKSGKRVSSKAGGCFVLGGVVEDGECVLSRAGVVALCDLESDEVARELVALEFEPRPPFVDDRRVDNTGKG